jgi:hypothetical protein
MSAVWKNPPIPATLHRTAGRPNVSATRSTVRPTACSSVTSQT